MHQAPGFYSKRAVVQYSNRSNIATFTLLLVSVLIAQQILNADIRALFFAGVWRRINIISKVSCFEAIS